MNFTASALAALLLVAPSAQAAPTLRIDAAHQELVNAIERAGIDVKVNPSVCRRRSADGWYWAARKELVVCQDNAVKGGAEVAWTANDLDTLRHEAHHLVQDLLDGTIDGNIQSVSAAPVEDALISLGRSRTARIIKAYQNRGRDTIRTELDAFTFAAANQPLNAAAAIDRLTGN